MDILRFIPVKLTLLLVAGILLGKYLDPGLLFSTLFVGLSFLTVAILFFWYSSEFSPVFGIAVSFAILATGAMSYSLSLPENHPGHYLKKGAGVAQILHLKVRDVLKSSGYQSSYIVQIQAINYEKARGRLLMQLPKDRPVRQLQTDEELLLWGAIEQLPAPRNPHQFDYSEYLRNRRIYHRIRPNTTLIQITAIPHRTLQGIAEHSRKKVINRLAECGFSKKDLAIVQALLLGERQDIPNDTYEAYKRAGAIHILAVSGLHIGILMWFIDLLLFPFKKIPGGKRFCLFLLLIILWAYAFLAGMSASIIRAVSMFSFLAYAWQLKRPANSFNLLALSMFFVLLAVDPNLLFQPGFQMSYAAVFAIVWMYPIFQGYWQPRYLLTKKIWQLFSLSLSAQLGVLPITLYYFHQFPGLFMLTNLILVPGLGLVLGLGFINVVLALSDHLPVLLAKVHATMIATMNTVVIWIAEQEVFVFKSIHFDIPKLILGYSIIIGLVICLRCLTFKKIVLVGIAIITWQLWGLSRSLELYKKETLWILHQNKNSLLLHQKGKRMVVNTRADTLPGRLLSNIALGEGTARLDTQSLKNAYQWNRSKLYILDERVIIPAIASENLHLLLVNSPKVHLGRLLDSLAPKMVLSDGSNYRTYVARWKSSCAERGIPFHDTARDGAFRIDMAP